MLVKQHTKLYVCNTISSATPLQSYHAKSYSLVGFTQWVAEGEGTSVTVRGLQKRYMDVRRSKTGLGNGLVAMSAKFASLGM